MSSRPWFKRRAPAGDVPRRARSPGWIGPSLEAGDRHTLRLQFVFFVLAVLVLALLIELIRPGTASKPSTPSAPCENGGPRNPLTGLCIAPSAPIGPPIACATDAPKTDQCVCDGGRHVDQTGRCVLPAASINRCDTAREIIRRCDEKRGGKTSDQCSALEIFRESALTDEDTESILAGFPNTMTVHFGKSEPSSTVPSTALTNALAGRGDALRGADRIFLLGRADNGSGSALDNDKMALKRLQAVRAAILGGLTGTEREELNKRIIDFGLGGNLEMDLERFAKRYTEILDAGDARISRLLERGLSKLRGGTLSHSEKKELKGAINRSVQIILVDPECQLGSPSPPALGSAQLKEPV